MEVIKWYRNHGYDGATPELVTLDRSLVDFHMELDGLRHQKRMLGKKYQTPNQSAKMISDQIDLDMREVSALVLTTERLIEFEVMWN